MSRHRSVAIDKILGKSFKVLDDGFVRVVDYMGTDDAIVQAARISYGAGTKKVQEDRALIRYLMRHRHTTPFEMCELKLHVRVPMDCWRQWIRHRTANVNEYSTRYSIAIDAAQKTKPDRWRIQASGRKQGSDGFVARKIGAELSRDERRLQSEVRRVYSKRLRYNVAREQARKDLSLSTYTEAYWKIDLHNLFHFLELRMSPNAQDEIRDYANLIGSEIVSRWCPVAWGAFEDYRRGSLSLSRIEASIVGALTRGDTRAALRVARNAGWVGASLDALPRSRERDECQEKLRQLELAVPWATPADAS